ncbi:23S rRNA (uracil(1939)-C(5))-methyltransferase RlmD [Dethiobacter alkaliphilus]|uniref:23S rRNA (uracil(1939)-C(5))-methyltransferase RlmD n=1 Tax=Dethiobacter alkaliphilus TaxID=427926 RepID=UPI0022267B27|nr:23S rRNA (uracil(1939)-C(5))-methyltransferase RlmD [Dethiobacter alkaliphilus]MCW3489475.1 23S rRNA (uracil(1939)-C(5))-methyltransferase RlmD [Dethiobacter alkaliphilus]
MKKKPPVKKGQQVELEIHSLNHDGEGVGRYQGFTIFVPDAVPGDTVNAKVISVQKSYARALLQSVITSSPTRIAPSCEHAAQCGGCQLQHLQYEEQLKLKQNIVSDALKRIGGIDIHVLVTMGMQDPWRYRNKAQVPVGLENGTVRAGFYEKRSHNIIDLKCCHIQHPANDNVVQTVRNILQQLSVPVYREREHKGLVRHILARTSFTTEEVLVAIITNGRQLPKKQEVVQQLKDSIPNLCGIVQNINNRKGNTILGNEEFTLWGRPWLREQLGDLQFHVSARSFFQVNPLQTEVLYNKALEYANLSGTETVFDLYCGIGTISLFLARKAAKVVGVESVEAAVHDARENAKVNNIENAEFHTGTAETVVPRLFKQDYHADVVVVDPPRKGCDEKLLATIAAMRPQRVVYVSCNPATLARDLKYLQQNGYNPIEAQPVDMFPHTSHVETVVLLERK